MAVAEVLDHPLKELMFAVVLVSHRLWLSGAAGPSCSRTDWSHARKLAPIFRSSSKIAKVSPLHTVPAPLKALQAISIYCLRYWRVLFEEPVSLTVATRPRPRPRTRLPGCPDGGAPTRARTIRCPDPRAPRAINFGTTSLLGGAWEHVKSGSPVPGSTR